MAKQPKPRPTDDEALFLIFWRRKRARDVLNELLHGFAGIYHKMPTPDQMLDYLTNTILHIEMSFKLLSGDWSSHNVGKMHETVFGRTHPSLALMEALKSATMDQKYLMSPAAGIIDHLPELEELGEALYGQMRQRFGKFEIESNGEIPGNFGRFLVDNVERYYRSGPVSVPASKVGDLAWAEAQRGKFEEEVQQVRANLGEYLNKGNKLDLKQA